MQHKGRLFFILLLVVVGLSVYAYAAKSDSGRVKLSTIYFKNDSTVIGAEFEDDLKSVQAALEADPTIGLQIEAYRWHSGTPEKNRTILQKRAEAVRQWFVTHGVDASRLVINSSEDAAPAVEKDKPKGPLQGERVEILQVSLKLPLAHLPALRYEFAPVLEGREVIHDFIIQNNGSAPLEIQKVRTD